MSSSRSGTDDTEKRSGIRRTSVILAVVALAFYAGFILLGVLNS